MMIGQLRECLGIPKKRNLFMQLLLEKLCSFAYALKPAKDSPQPNHIPCRIKGPWGLAFGCTKIWRLQ
jgi:hypothetical protein